MDDQCGRKAMPASQALAIVTREFVGSRLERQLLAQAFDVLWQSETVGLQLPVTTTERGRSRTNHEMAVRPVAVASQTEEV